jgi:hypothetical protein
MIKQKFKHICSLRNMVAPQGNLNSFSPWDMIIP